MGRGRRSTTREDLRKMKRPIINGGDGGEGGGSGDDDEIFGAHDSDNYSTVSGGEHSSDEDALKPKGSPTDDKQ